LSYGSASLVIKEITIMAILNLECKVKKIGFLATVLRWDDQKVIEIDRGGAYNS
jgi:hypothetical protein